MRRSSTRLKTSWFSRRTLYKYELDERGFPLRVHPVDLQERRAVVRRAGERLAQKWGEQDRMIEEYLPTALALRAAACERRKEASQLFT